MDNLEKKHDCYININDTMLLSNLKCVSKCFVDKKLKTAFSLLKLVSIFEVLWKQFSHIKQFVIFFSTDFLRPYKTNDHS